MAHSDTARAYHVPMFSIIGIRKLKQRGQVAQRASHHLRGHAVLNADPARFALNASNWKRSARELADEIWARTEPAMQRKDGVRVIELLLTASPEWFTDDCGGIRTKELMLGARDFLGEVFGAQNVAAWGLHRDEKTPHVWALVTPIHEGKLKASRWLDGPSKLAALHTKWAEKMKPYGLQRGGRKSGASHVDIRTYYSAVNGNQAAQETISREMARRAARAKRRAEAAESQASAIEALAAKNRAIFDALDAASQERAAALFADAEQASPCPGSAEPPIDRVTACHQPSPTIRHNRTPSPT
jgi:hypothetical protein